MLTAGGYSAVPNEGKTARAKDVLGLAVAVAARSRTGNESPRLAGGRGPSTSVAMCARMVPERSLGGGVFPRCDCATGPVRFLRGDR